MSTSGVDNKRNQKIKRKELKQ